MCLPRIMNHAAARLMILLVFTRPASICWAGEDKSSNEVITQEKAPFWTWYTDIGYQSEYIFRGTNLTPNSDGDGFVTVQVSKWNFTLGCYDIHQFGRADAPAYSTSEGGGGGTPSINFFGFTGPISPITFQTRFNEFDAYLQYKWELGAFDVAV